ncbi:hypothetical protein ABPG75_007162 [Micractinium tetrahymenae]
MPLLLRSIAPIKMLRLVILLLAAAAAAADLGLRPQDMAAIAVLDWTFVGPTVLAACRPETFLNWKNAEMETACEQELVGDANGRFVRLEMPPRVPAMPAFVLRVAIACMCAR